HGGFKVLAGGEVLIDFGEGLHGVKDDVGGVGESVDGGVGCPVCAGNFLIRGSYDLHELCPVLVVTLFDLNSGDFKKPSVGHVSLGSQAELLVQDEHGAIGLAEQVAIHRPGVVEGG